MTVGSVEKLIASSKPQHVWKRSSSLLLLGLGLLLGAFLADPELFDKRGVPAWLLPQIALIVLIVLTVHAGWRQRQLTRLMLAGFEAAQLHEWDRARQALIELLQRPMRQLQARAESLLALASVAEAGHHYAAAQRIYEAVLIEQTASPIQLHTTNLALAAVMLRTGQTTDAVDLIDRLTRVELPAPLRAQVELLALFREVAMGQAANGIDRAEQRRELFRHYLSTRAGYGYGLLAAAFDHAKQPEVAKLYWNDATLLVHPQELLERFEELKPIAAKYQAAEYAL